VGAAGGLRGRALAAFFGEDVVQGDVEVGVGDGDLGEVLDELGGHGVVVVVVEGEVEVVGSIGDGRVAVIR
jgi:hypothetical protein